MTLFELGAQYKSLEALLDSEDLPEEVIRDTVEGLTGEIEHKAVNVAKVVLHLKKQAENIMEVAEAMAARATRIQKRSESLKAYLLFVLQSIDMQKVDTAEMTIRRQVNPESVTVFNESTIPPEYWYQPPPPPKAIDKKKLKEALKDGALIEGAFCERGEHLRIIL
jgi:hypothetical protein